MADVSDAYNVSTGLDPHEFIIRLSRQGVTSYFSSPYRDNIVKVYSLNGMIFPKSRLTVLLQAIRSAKSQLRDSQVLRIERFPRFSNISATLLHVGMININSDQEELRGAAYDLLGAICSYLDYDKNPIIASKGVWFHHLVSILTPRQPALFLVTYLLSSPV